MVEGEPADHPVAAPTAQFRAAVGRVGEGADLGGEGFRVGGAVAVAVHAAGGVRFDQGAGLVDGGVAVRAVDDDGLAEGEAAERGAAHAEDQVGGLVGGARVGALAGEHDGLAAEFGVEAGRLGAQRLFAGAAADHGEHQVGVVEQADGGHGAADAGVLLQAGDQPGDDAEQQLGGGGADFGAEGGARDGTRRVQFGVDGWFDQPQVAVAEGPAVRHQCAEAEDQGLVAGHAAEHPDAVEGGDDREAALPAGAEVGVAGGADLPGVDELGAVFVGEAAESGADDGVRGVGVAGDDEVEVVRGGEFDERGGAVDALGEQHGLVAPVAQGAGDVDGVELGAAERQVVEVDQDADRTHAHSSHWCGTKTGAASTTARGGVSSIGPNTSNWPAECQLIRVPPSVLPME